ncbi:carboxypeptidase regulatory-like domain-containing protein [Gemmatirosa kalamazoonensis]|nr:carboxypeptidase regulatory-like domain-containing protein [Gemmatirosa kalamazoonensis]
MPHLDEGTAHAWLDGALSPEESARVESHVESCRDCAALVAEARGLIAGATRIVGALDIVPGGVIPTPAAAPVAPVAPVAAPRPARHPRRWMVRAAAGIAVLVGGTTVVMRSASRPQYAAADSVAYSVPAAAPGPSAAAADLATPSMAPAPTLPAPTQPVAEGAPPMGAREPALAERRASTPAIAAGSAPRTAPTDAAKLAASAPPRADAPRGTIAGMVTDPRGAPLPLASVTVAGAPQGATSDSAGRFVLPAVPAGEATVVARRLGYGPGTATVTVAPAETASTALTLSSAAVALSQTVVTGAAAAAPAATAQRMRAGRAAPRSDDRAVAGCYVVRLDATPKPDSARSLGLPMRLRLDAPPRAGARWSLDADGTLRVTLGTAPTSLVLRAADDGWSGTATADGRSAPVSLTRASDCEAR